MAEKSMIIIITLLISFVFSAFLEVALLCIIFIPLREYAGGFHAKNRAVCQVISSIFILVGILGIKILVNHINLLVYGLGEFICAIIIILCAPVDTINHKISDSERKYFKNVTRGILVVEITMGIVFIQMANIPAAILIAHSSAASSLLIEKIYQKRLEIKKQLK